MKLILGDITQITTDALVNAANTQLQHGGGVAAAIARAGGEIIQKESDQIGWCDIGKAVVTGAGRLPAKCLIHVPTIDYTTGKKASLEDIKKRNLSSSGNSQKYWVQEGYLSTSWGWSSWINRGGSSKSSERSSGLRTRN